MRSVRWLPASWLRFGMSGRLSVVVIRLSLGRRNHIGQQGNNGRSLALVVSIRRPAKAAASEGSGITSTSLSFIGVCSNVRACACQRALPAPAGRRSVRPSFRSQIPSMGAASSQRRRRYYKGGTANEPQGACETHTTPRPQRNPREPSPLPCSSQAALHRCSRIRCNRCGRWSVGRLTANRSEPCPVRRRCANEPAASSAVACKGQGTSRALHQRSLLRKARDPPGKHGRLSAPTHGTPGHRPESRCAASVGRERHAARRRFWSSGGPCGLERTEMKRAAIPCLLLLAACGGGGGDSPEAVSAAGPAPAAAPQRRQL